MTRLAKAGLCVACVGLYAAAVAWLLAHPIDSPAGSHSQAIWDSAIAARGGNVDEGEWVTYRAIYNAGHAAIMAGDVVEAVKRFRACFDRAPRNSAPFALSCAWLGVICEHMGDAEGADKYYAAYMRQAAPMVLNARSQIPGAWRRYRMLAMERGQRQ